MSAIRQKKTFERAGSTVEYMALVIFLLAALLVFQRYILRAFWGKWRAAGDTFGHGRQYDPRGFGIEGSDGGTLQCMFVYDDPDDPANDNGVWVEQPCYDECILTIGSEGQCRADCINTNYCAGE